MLGRAMGSKDLDTIDRFLALGLSFTETYMRPQDEICHISHLFSIKTQQKMALEAIRLFYEVHGKDLSDKNWCFDGSEGNLNITFMYDFDRPPLFKSHMARIAELFEGAHHINDVDSIRSYVTNTMYDLNEDVKDFNDKFKPIFERLKELKEESSCDDDCIIHEHCTLFTDVTAKLKDANIERQDMLDLGQDIQELLSCKTKAEMITIGHRIKKKEDKIKCYPINIKRLNKYIFLEIGKYL